MHPLWSRVVFHHANTVEPAVMASAPAHPFLRMVLQEMSSPTQQQVCQPNGTQLLATGLDAQLLEVKLFSFIFLTRMFDRARRSPDLSRGLVLLPWAESNPQVPSANLPVVRAWCHKRYSESRSPPTDPAEAELARLCSQMIHLSDTGLRHEWSSDVRRHMEGAVVWHHYQHSWAIGVGNVNGFENLWNGTARRSSDE